MILSIVRVPNGSFSEAYHAFLDHVESDYVLFLSTDDIMTEDHFNRLSLLLKGHPCDILVFDYYLRYLDGFEEWNRANTYSCNGTVLQKMIISAAAEIITIWMTMFMARGLSSNFGRRLAPNICVSDRKTMTPSAARKI